MTEQSQPEVIRMPTAEDYCYFFKDPIKIVKPIVRRIATFALHYENTAGIIFYKLTSPYEWPTFIID